MAEEPQLVGVPIPESQLRDIAKGVQKILPDFAGQERSLGVKHLNSILDPLLDTADVSDLSPSHRAAASNALCAIIEACQTSRVEYVLDALLVDSIWFRLLEIYLQRSDNAKGKSMRQLLLVLTSMLLNIETPQSKELRERATSTLIDILCLRQDRIKVKPALQGLAHFLLKDVITITQLIKLYNDSKLTDRTSKSLERSIQAFFGTVLSWIVHHDTALSAGHLVKNFLLRVRSTPMEITMTAVNGRVQPPWVEPVVDVLRHWPERIQEFKTHVFPHCFLPDIDEFLSFLSYLHFDRHVKAAGDIPRSLKGSDAVDNKLSSTAEFKLILGTIQSGKEIGIIKDVDSHLRNNIELQKNTLELPDDLFTDWLSRPEPEVRLAGLYLSVYSTSITKPFTAEILRSIKRNLVHLHTDTDANFRKEVLNHTQRLFDRLRGSTSTLSRTNVKTGSKETSRAEIPAFLMSRHKINPSANDALLSTSLEFIAWYIRFLIWELRYTASYQRRSTALRCLSIVLRSGLDPNVPPNHLSKSAQGQLRWAFSYHVTTPCLVRILLDLVLDPFDDIRNAAVATLEICLDSLPQQEKPSMLSALPMFLERAETMMLRTGRADQADGLARAYALIFSQCADDIFVDLNAAIGKWTRSSIIDRLIDQLEDTIDVARKDLSAAVNGRPVHGIFAALRYIIDHESYSHIRSLPTDAIPVWKQKHHRICSCIEALWSCVKDVLCADAPEGHVPDDFDEETSLDTKEVLSYSWRGLKEASILLRTIVSRSAFHTPGSALVEPDELKRLGQLCFSQLVELRHRGAFSTVAQTFAAFCPHCTTAREETLRALPLDWYQEALLCIQDKATSITRRSAGIPSLMIGVIASESPPGPLFDRAMKDLVSEASRNAVSSNIEESRLPQVHALNCIKEFFMTSKLSIVSEAYIGAGLDVAARTLNSSIWPIRNCGLMLFKALIERLLGSDEAQDWKEQDRTKTSRFSYTNYPSLIGILSDLLNPHGALKKSMAIPDSNSPLDLHGAEGVFPALQILRQAPPPEENRAAITESVIHLLQSPHWHLRDMAARTVVSLKFSHEYFDTILSLLSIQDLTYNSQHGVLLCLKYLMRKYLRSEFVTSDSTAIIIEKLGDLCQPIYEESKCPFTRAAFMDLANICGTSLLLTQPKSHRVMSAWSALSSSLASLKNKISAVNMNAALLRVSTTQGLLIHHVIQYAGSEQSLVNPENKSSFKDLLLEDSSRDPDTCCALLEALPTIARQAANSPLDVCIPDILEHLYSIITRVENEEVKSKAQAVLADFFSVDQDLTKKVLAEVEPKHIVQGLEELEHQCIEGSPASMQSALHLYGFVLDFAFRANGEQEKSMLERISRYIRLLRMTIIDTNPFDTRFAASQSLASLTHILSMPVDSKSAEALVIGLSLVLHTLLTDDDDEIRDLAAATTTRFLRAQSSQPNIPPAVPITSTQRLIKFLIRSFPDSEVLRKESLRRLVGTPSRSPLFARPFADVLATEREEDTALFAREKQNLYKDDIEDAAMWTRILKSSSPRSRASISTSELRTWVVDALHVLTTTAQNEHDGALGWTSKNEVFALGLRVIGATEVVLQWDRQGGADVRRALKGFIDAAVVSHVHGLWVERAETVLKLDVFALIREAHQGISRILI